MLQAHLNFTRKLRIKQTSFQRVRDAKLQTKTSLILSEIQLIYYSLAYRVDFSL